MFKVINRKGFPMHRALSQMLSTVLAEQLETVKRLQSAKALVIASDFSATNKTAVNSGQLNGLTRTVGLVICALDDLKSWTNGPRNKWRSEAKYPEDTISYKKVSSSESDLEEMSRFLYCAVKLPGLAVTCTLPKTPEFVFTKKNDSKEHAELEEFRKWKPGVFESLMRFFAVATVALTPVLCEGQTLHWLSDNDDIVANDSFAKSAAFWFGLELRALTGVLVPPILTVPRSIQPEYRLMFEDVLSICDLAAGGMGEYLERCKEEYGLVQGGPLGPPPLLRVKAEEIALWFGADEGSLVRVPLQLEPISKIVMVHQIDRVRKDSDFSTIFCT